MKDIIIILFILYILRVIFKFRWLFRTMRFDHLIEQGLYTSEDLDAFPVNHITGDEYNLILEKASLFVHQALSEIECVLSLNVDEINCLVSQGLTPVKPQALGSGGLLFYYFVDNKLFEEKMCSAGTKVGHYNTELSINFGSLLTPPDGLPSRPGIFIRHEEIALNPRVSFIYRSRFISSIFNSDLDFTKEEITDVLKKVTSLAIVDSQLVFTADPNNQIFYD
jgi:hypothetical protein